MNRETILEKIRALLRKGDLSRNSSAKEAEAAIALAHRLIAKYQIDQAEISEPAPKAFYEHTVAVGTIPVWKYVLIDACAKLIGVEAATYRISGMRGKRRVKIGMEVKFYGEELLCHVAAALWESLCKIANSAGRQVNGEKERDAFRHGFARGVECQVERLARGESMAASEKNAYALVRINTTSWIRSELDKRGVLSMAMVKENLEQRLAEMPDPTPAQIKKIKIKKITPEECDAMVAGMRHGESVNLGTARNLVTREPELWDVCV